MKPPAARWSQLSTRRLCSEYALKNKASDLVSLECRFLFCVEHDESTCLGLEGNIMCTQEIWILSLLDFHCSLDGSPSMTETHQVLAFLVDLSWADPQKTSRVGTLPKVKMEMDSDIEMPWFCHV